MDLNISFLSVHNLLGIISGIKAKMAFDVLFAVERRTQYDSLNLVTEASTRS